MVVVVVGGGGGVIGRLLFSGEMKFLWILILLSIFYLRLTKKFMVVQEKKDKMFQKQK